MGSTSETCLLVMWHDTWHSEGVCVQNKVPLSLSSLPSLEVLRFASFCLSNMDDELCHEGVETGGLSPCTPSTSAADGAVSGSFSGENWKCGADRMVKIELEAAETLAGLAHSAMHESKNPGAESGWNEGEGESQRVKCESPEGDSGLNPEYSVPGSSDLAEDRAVVVQQQREKVCNVMIKTLKAEQDAELYKPSVMCTTSYASSSGGKSRQNLSEAEKEARRLRRVFANRESARQTIRRRQAMYEELTRKAADLAWENENLKRDKELAMKEYEALKNTNECLKAQTTKTIEAEVEETQKESKSPCVEISSTPSSNYPFFIYDQTPFTPFLWPSIIRSSSPFQLHYGSQNIIPVPSEVPMPSIGKPDSFHEQETLSGINGPGTPLYMLPCSWFFPFPDHGNRVHPQPSSHLYDIQNETSLDNQCSASSSSKSIAHIENHHSLMPFKIKTEASTSTEAIPSDNLHETPYGFPPDGGRQFIGHHSEGMALMPAPLKAVRPAATAKHENGPQPDYIPNAKAVSSTVSHTVDALPEKNPESIFCPKKLVDSVAASEARKRRKELTKLKNIHCRQFRMHC
ncbi:hypothetical protein F0562_016797 [Nyssa sinensis]|uniref:BZIP domain-containing protein n=1 Tax=Nyssa sinensis TaxID=561372 RepID=A0A5J4ZHI3_9ASTE|nr:hypothetical protein F0562_016797 [Nyssa sinensis]